jgi:hypothetical protein
LKVGKLKYLKMEMLYCKGNREKKWKEFRMKKVKKLIVRKVKVWKELVKMCKINKRVRRVK